MRRFLASVTLVLAAAAAFWLQAPPAQAQLWVIDEHYWVSELKPDKHAIGVSNDNDFHTDHWVYIDGDTSISTNEHRGGGLVAINVPPSQVWGWLKPGQRIKVHGGRRWDYNVNASKIWF